MPTYEYACSSCGHRFDVRQSFTEAPLTDCPQCGATVRRVLFPAGVIFKGSGWYKTDSRPASHSEAQSSTTSDGEASPAKADSEGKAPGPAKAEPKVTEPKKVEPVKPAADD